MWSHCGGVMNQDKCKDGISLNFNSSRLGRGDVVVWYLADRGARRMGDISGTRKVEGGN